MDDQFPFLQRHPMDCNCIVLYIDHIRRHEVFMITNGLFQVPLRVLNISSSLVRAVQYHTTRTSSSTCDWATWSFRYRRSTATLSTSTATNSNVSRRARATATSRGPGNAGTIPFRTPSDISGTSPKPTPSSNPRGTVTSKRVRSYCNPRNRTSTVRPREPINYTRPSMTSYCR